MKSIFPDFERSLVDVARTRTSSAGEVSASRTGHPGRSAGSTRRRSLPAGTVRRALPALGVLVVCAVVVPVALSGAHGRGRADGRGGVTQRSAGLGSRGGGDSLRALIGELGVLRRPQPAGNPQELQLTTLKALVALQTTGCQTFARFAKRRCATRPIEQLVRSVEVPGPLRGWTAVIVPEKQGHEDGSVILGLLGTTGRGTPGINNTFSAQPASAVQVAEQGVVQTISATADADQGVVLVPDGVSHVVLSGLRLPTEPRARVGEIMYAVTPVRDNVADFELAKVSPADLGLNTTELRRHIASATMVNRCGSAHMVYGLPATANMRWYGSNHQTLVNRHIALRLYVAATVRNPLIPKGATIPGCGWRVGLGPTA